VIAACRLAGLSLAVAFASGCAYVQMQPDGSRRVMGLVYLEIPPPGSADEIGGETIRIRSIGVGFASGPPGTTLAVGYFDSAQTIINNNSCIALKAASRSHVEGNNKGG
jgi:hypothetical protein